MKFLFKHLGLWHVKRKPPPQANVVHPRMRTRIDLKLRLLRKKINIDNKARFGYPDGYCCRLIGVSIC